MLNNENLLYLLAAEFRLVTATLVHLRHLSHALQFSELQFQPELLIFKFLLLVLFHRAFSHPSSAERCFLVDSD